MKPKARDILMFLIYAVISSLYAQSDVNIYVTEFNDYRVCK